MSEHQPVSTRQYRLREVWQFLSRLPSGRRISLAAAAIAFAGYGLAAWIPAFFVRIHHMTPGQLGLWMSWITALGGIIGSFSGGVMADRWGRTHPRARTYVGMSGALLSIPFNVASVLLADHRLALLCFFPATIGATLWFGPATSIVQDLAPPAMRATASAVFIFILTIIGLGAGPQMIGILNDWIGTPDAIRYSLLSVAIVMNLLAAWFFWLTGKTLMEDLRAKERI